MADKIVGYIVLWRMPEIDVTYDALTSIASDAGFDQEYIPQPPRKRGAWEKATNLGASGMKVNLPQNKAAEIRGRYGVEPTVKLETKVVSKAAPRLIRHLVRTVTIPVLEDTSDKRGLARKQLSSETVCIMEFDCKTEEMTSTSYKELHDYEGWVNGSLLDVVKQIEDAADKAMNHADGLMMAGCVRQYLLHHAATLMSSSGGAYFVPYKSTAFDSLKSLKVFVESLADYRVDKKAKAPQVTILPLTDSGEAFEAKLDIASNAVEAFKEELQKVTFELQPVLNGERTENVSRNVRERATLAFMEINQKIQAYRQALGDNLEQLNFQLQMAEESIIAAQSASYKSRRADKEE